MFNIGIGEMALLVVVALVVFGPERLPSVIAEAARMLRSLRKLADNAKAEIRSELGPELGDLDLDSLNPKTFVRKHLFEDGSPFDEIRGLGAGLPLDEIRGLGAGLTDSASPAPHLRPNAAPALKAGEKAPYDEDAT